MGRLCTEQSYLNRFRPILEEQMNTFLEHCRLSSARFTFEVTATRSVENKDWCSSASIIVYVRVCRNSS